MGQFVNVLLELHTEYTELVQTTFQGDQAFYGSRDKACTKIVNVRLDPKKPCRSPELVSCLILSFVVVQLLEYLHLWNIQAIKRELHLPSP